MLLNGLEVVLLLGNGLVSGVFFAVSVSVLPTLLKLPAGRYVEMHRLLGKGYHPVMPVIVNVATIAGLALGVLAPDAAAKALFFASAAVLVGVQAVSHLGNVPLNRSIADVDPDRIPPDWVDPRSKWRSRHQVRTALAFAAMFGNCLAVVLPA